MTVKKTVFILLTLTLAAALFAPPPAGAQEISKLQADDGIAAVSIGSGSVTWQPRVAYERLVLTVSGPDGAVSRREFAAGEPPRFDLVDDSGNLLADGSYGWELRVVPPAVGKIDRVRRERIDRLGGAAADPAAGRPAQPAVLSGYFAVAGGAFVTPDAVERRGGDLASAPEPEPRTTFTDSLCVGFDCPASPSFSDSTVLLMENNTRIKFDDTSSLSGFPNRDWSLVANDTASGGANRFSIQDCGVSSQGGCSGNIPFSIVAGARNNSLYVDSGGRLGLGTSTPVLDIHGVRGNTPSLRLEQDGSSGFAPQTWDVAGNESNFFVRDATNGSRLPFRIQPSAPSNSIFIGSSGNVGVGTSSPGSDLHVFGSDGTTQLMVEETSGTAAGRILLQLRNNGNVQFRFSNGTDTWQMSQFSSSFAIDEVGDPAEFIVRKNGTIAVGDPANPLLDVKTNGDLQIQGVLITGSSRELKNDLGAVDGQEILAQLSELPLRLWSYKSQDEGIKHLGPMAEEFYAAFGLGRDATGLSTVDTVGVALAAIQGLQQTVADRDGEIAELKLRLAEIERRLDALSP